VPQASGLSCLDLSSKVSNVGGGYPYHYLLALAWLFVLLEMVLIV